VDSNNHLKTFLFLFVLNNVSIPELIYTDELYPTKTLCGWRADEHLFLLNMSKYPTGGVSQDWEEVVIKKKVAKPKDNKEAAVIARKEGTSVEAVKKFTAGTNKAHKGPDNAKKLDDETEELGHKKLDHNVALRIQQARQAKSMTQKELATKINEKQDVISGYESGKVIPNNQILGKLERALGVKLRGKLEE